MSKSLVIVESPTKAKTISKFLKNGYIVESSFGHLRDLPKSKMGINIEDESFEPEYIIPKDKNKYVKILKEKSKKADEIIFATDEDREGEAISWHLAQILGIDPKKAKRIVFHEITKRAIEEAIKNPRHIDKQLVNAQQARRILDRLVGYELSPFLWKKVARGLSAGRVQSVALRLIVEREREIKKFIPQEYWTLLGIFDIPTTKKKEQLEAKLYSIDDKRLKKLDIKQKKEIDEILQDLKTAKYKITKITKKETKRTPPPPFTTSTLQQNAHNKLGYSSKQIMRIAQQLYEGVKIGSHGHVGLITYMRTDSLNLSNKFTKEVKDFINKEFGNKYSIEKIRYYKNKSKGAQEAHEAIRPTDPEKTPESIKEYLTPQQYKIYDLIWKRAVATQMKEARLNKTSLDISAKKYTFRASGQTMIFSGWLKLYPKSIKEEMLPDLKEGLEMDCSVLKPEQHFTEPPARYSDATLVKALEEHGIGRPSTYAPTIATIEARKYVERDENKRLMPTEISFLVNDLLVKHFSDIVDYEFTAEMEEDLDTIAEGEKKWKPIIRDFYKPFHKNLEKKTKELSKKELTEEETDEKCEKCGSDMIIKLGRFGKFMACSNYPECKNTKPVDPEERKEEETDEKCEKCGSDMIVKHGRYGTFLGCSNYPDCKNIKPIEKKTGVKCNKCNNGEFIEKRTKKGRTFYGCNRYPDCENALWSKPTGENCPQCKQPLVFGSKKVIRCSNKECKYKKNNK
ncbi:MAG: type I DNA topoisomerase [Candidatus Magasanikbacteria bacterium]|nr:type I DNA topoisomerase [Candidatus Magasanikbacteria bacterium]